MCLEKASPFTRMILGALLGALLGIASGFVFGLLISWMTVNITPFGGMMMSGDFTGPGSYGFTSFFGMGAGAIIGAILGGVYSNKKE